MHMSREFFLLSNSLSKHDFLELKFFTFIDKFCQKCKKTLPLHKQRMKNCSNFGSIRFISVVVSPDEVVWSLFDPCSAAKSIKVFSRLLCTPLNSRKSFFDKMINFLKNIKMYFCCIREIQQITLKISILKLKFSQ